MYIYIYIYLYIYICIRIYIYIYIYIHIYRIQDPMSRAKQTYRVVFLVLLRLWHKLRRF